MAQVSTFSFQKRAEMTLTHWVWLLRSFPESFTLKLQLISHGQHAITMEDYFSPRHLGIHFAWINFIQISTFLDQYLWLMHWLAQPRPLIWFLNYSRDFSCNFIPPGPCSRDFQDFPLLEAWHLGLSSGVPPIKFNKNILNTYHMQANLITNNSLFQALCSDRLD